MILRISGGVNTSITMVRLLRHDNDDFNEGDFSNAVAIMPLESIIEPFLIRTDCVYPIL